MSISSIVSLAAGKIGELLVKEVKLLYGMEDQVQSLQEELTIMNSFLIDMESMYEEVDDQRSRTANKQIRKIAYDAEDVIKSYILEADKKNDLLKRYLSFCTSLPQTHQIGSEIVKIKRRWKNFKKENRLRIDLNGVRIDLRQGLNKTRARTRPIAYPHTCEDLVVGLDDDINKLVRVLTTNEDTKIKVVSIVGMGGSGKTTIARKLFNHKTVKNHFDCFAWVSVSQQWDTQQILLNLWNEVSGDTMGMDAFFCTVLPKELHQFLERKRYLIVLDDVWKEKALEDILPALPLGNDGSRIIVTTRKKKLVDYPDLKPFTYPHEPRRLKEDESWELFRKIALIREEETNNYSMDIAKLEELGKEMLKKCKGLPLAVIALAGILWEKETLEEWDQINKAVCSWIMEDGKGTLLYGPVNQMLALSYRDLPPELKPCFLYLARYPEDHKISVGMLIRMWIAEGFFTTAKRHEGGTIEDVAHRCLDELFHRYLVQVVDKDYNGNVKTIQIHDLVRDLCIREAKEEEFLETFTSKCPNSDTIATESRRIAIHSYDGMYVPFPTKSQHLRSLEYVVDKKEQSPNLQLIHENFRLLRVLLLIGVRTSDDSLPAEIGSLIHLRYLGLRNTYIRELPSSIGNLRNLLTLECRHATYGSELRIPDVLWKIESLRYLYLENYENINRGTLKLSTLKYLQTLKGVPGGSWILKELPVLSPSVQNLSISRITSQEQLDAAFQCPSIREDSLHSLALDWDGYRLSDEIRESRTVNVSKQWFGISYKKKIWRCRSSFFDQHKLESLEPIIHSQRLRKLWLSGRIVDKFGIQFPASIKKLVLQGTKLEAEATLVALGKLPRLAILQLWRKAYMGTEWACTAGDFPQLKELLLYNIQNLEEWSTERGAMPQLSKLVVWDCKKLRVLPEGLRFITTLQELQIKSMPEKFKQRLKGGEDAHIIQHVPLVQIR